MTKIKILTIALLGFGTSGSSFAAVNGDTQEAANKMGAHLVEQIRFEAGSTLVSAGAKRSLKDFVATARKGGKIKEVRVAAWSDQEYPAGGTSLVESQVSLAERRADAVSAYLKKGLSIDNVSVLNMAVRPNVVQRTLGTPVADNKATMETTGAAPTSDEQTGVFGLRGKASEVVILVFYQK